jgi:hypothetical protein
MKITQQIQPFEAVKVKLGINYGEEVPVGEWSMYGLAHL